VSRLCAPENGWVPGEERPGFLRIGPTAMDVFLRVHVPTEVGHIRGADGAANVGRFPSKGGWGQLERVDPMSAFALEAVHRICEGHAGEDAKDRMDVVGNGIDRFQVDVGVPGGHAEMIEQDGLNVGAEHRFLGTSRPEDMDPDGGVGARHVGGVHPNCDN